MYPHRIRLRGPWECAPLAGAEPLPPPRRMTLPCRWAEGGLLDFAGRVRFTRRFGAPGRVDDFERVWLTAAGVDAAAELRLNGQPLGQFTAAESFEADVTTLLKPRNELIADVTGDARGGLWGEVALEIRCTAYLRHVRAEPSPNLIVTGEVVGTASGPLELYLVVGRSTAAYAVVQAAPTGVPFRLVADALTAPRPDDAPAAWKVDLVHGASIWYTFEQALAHL